MSNLKRAMNESPLLRWTMLVIVSISMFANYYFYDALSPLKEVLDTQLNWNSANFGFFFSAYSIPNAFLLMAVIGGVILDKLGIRITGFTFVAFMVIGSAITAYGATDYFNNGGFGYGIISKLFPNLPASLIMMSFGFFIFGLGAETSIVVLNKIIVKWFMGKELALALGMNLAFGRMGMAAAMWWSPSLSASPDTWQNAIWFGTILLLIGMITFVIYLFYDLKLDRQISEAKIEEDEEPFRFADIKQLLSNRSFIYITLLCVTFYSAVFPFVKFAPDLLTNKFGMDIDLAGKITSILPFGTMLFTPIFGLYADFKGKNASIMLYGSILLIVVHLMFSLTTISPLIPMFLLGVTFSLIPAAMWPSVAKIVPEKRLGSAYGFMFSVQNLGLAAFPFLIGVVLNFYNPDPNIKLQPDQVASVVENGGVFNSRFTDRKNRALGDKEIRLVVSVYNDSIDGNLVWQEYHSTHTDESGNYYISLGKGNNVREADLSELIIPWENLKLELENEVGESIVMEINKHDIINKALLNIDPEADFLLEKKKEELIAAILSPDAEGKIIWKERISAIRDENGLYNFELGKGKFLEINEEYFNWQNQNLYCKIKEPLDYTNTILMLVILGSLGMVFAQLLKREDKVSGYGLELPNRKS